MVITATFDFGVGMLGATEKSTNESATGGYIFTDGNAFMDSGSIPRGDHSFLRICGRF